MRFGNLFFFFSTSLMERNTGISWTNLVWMSVHCLPFHCFFAPHFCINHLAKIIRELSGVILTRGPKLCNFVEWRGYKVVYKRWFDMLNNPCIEGNLLSCLTNGDLSLFLCRYASLYFCMCIDQDDNELEILEIIHHFVEILDRYFGSVSKTDH